MIKKASTILAVICGFSVSAASADIRLFVPGEYVTTDIIVVCSDNHGYKVFYDTGSNWSPGIATTSLNEIFSRASHGGDASYTEVSGNNSAFKDCGVDLDDLETGF